MKLHDAQVQLAPGAPVNFQSLAQGPYLAVEAADVQLYQLGYLLVI